MDRLAEHHLLVYNIVRVPNRFKMTYNHYLNGMAKTPAVELDERPMEKYDLKSTIYSRVCEGLRSAIISGKYAPGARLKIRNLTKDFNVSQTAVRESLHQLQGEGLVTFLPRRGASVRLVDKKFVKNVYDLRFVIENMLIRKAAILIDRKAIDKLKRVNEKYSGLIDTGDIAKLLETNNKIHNIHNRIVDNQEALAALSRTTALLKGLRMCYGWGKDRNTKIWYEHEQLIKAFEDRDPDAAAAAHSHHSYQARYDLLSLMEDRDT